MQLKIILFLVFAFLISLAISFYQYLVKKSNRNWIHFLLFGLRGLSIFLLLTLLINPKIKRLKITNEKPVLAIAIDNSESISLLNSEKQVNDNIQVFKNNKALNNKFDVVYFKFSKSLQNLDSLTFESNQTNISKAINSLDELYDSQNGAIVLLTDGNQTVGLDYEFLNAKKAIYPLVIGDTTTYDDIKIKQVNVNKYSYLKNKFPVETLVSYFGNEEITTYLKISKNGKNVFRKRLKFSSIKKSETVIANLTSTKIGNNYYTISIDKIANEKNIKNNVSPFSVEVINEQTNVLLLTSFLHPDIGALKKAIESNPQRKVSIQINDKKIKLNDFELVILFQPNNNFKEIIQELNSKNQNFLLITGTKTDWVTLNNLSLGFTKNVINQTENYGAIFNQNFQTFVQKDIGFSDYPPLQDKFGEIKLNIENQILLFQSINGIDANQPLILSTSNKDLKQGFIFGEGLWKWRSETFLKQNSFKEFDDFIGNLVQFLASNKKRNRLEVSIENSYLANEIIEVSAFYVDENFQFDSRANIWFTYTNQETKISQKRPFSLNDNSYTLKLEDLPYGEYTYTISVENQKIKKTGKFTVLDYNAEAQFTSANHQKLKRLAENNGGDVYYFLQSEQLIKDLLNDNQYYTTQKSSTITSDLVDWKWLLGIIITLLSAEWFIRKYHGKI